MTVYLCEDNETNRTWWKKLMDTLNEKYSAGLTLRCVETGEQLLFAMEDNIEDVGWIYLDIGLPGVDGMQVAQVLRASGFSGDIVFFTAHEEEMPRAFDVDACNFIIKGKTSGEKFEEVFLKTLNRAHRRMDRSMIFSYAGERRCVMLENICYFEVNQQIVTVHYGEEQFDFYGRIGRLEEKLAGHGFVRCHRAYLVNSAYITHRQGDQLVLRGDVKLPIGRAYAKGVQALLR